MNRENTRVAGVLLPVASLPSPYGAGGFGKDAYAFVDFLAETGFRLWQVLPLNPLGDGNSPYQSDSSYAIDPLYIDLAALQAEGYLPEPTPALPNPGRIDYDLARRYRRERLAAAFAAFEAQGRERDAFCRFCAQSWVYPYAKFITYKRKNGMRCWNRWPQPQREEIVRWDGDLDACEPELRLEMFLQYEAYKQWTALKRYANEKGVQIFGDVPFYVGYDSLDVWQNREAFLLDAKGDPAFVAGVPPDYFSATGQRWGNPIYHWDYLEKTGFRFWLRRLGHSAALYDLVRIDHFRAFDTYWRIPASCRTAVEGKWVEAPGRAFFDALFAELPDIRLVAEDLGQLRPQVRQLRVAYGLPGMCVAQFTLPEEEEREENQVMYTGTHDNQTVSGWLSGLEDGVRGELEALLDRRRVPDGPLAWRMLGYLFGSAARYAVAPAADLLGLDDSARLNTPGTVGSPNWEWRLTSLEPLRARGEALRRLLRDAGRA